jgi:uncharacterized protein YbgA (DUF1722 family)/uncharacterized protein YbbK (DUF523 family)
VSATAAESPLRLGVSACLLGHRVRHDAGHKRDAFVTERLGPFVEWVPVCPEVELGLGIPRPTIRLERRSGALRLIEPRSGADLSGPMRAFAADRVAQLEALELCGYVLKADSPSCGMAGVRVWPVDGGPVTRSGRGLFACHLMQRLPLLPVEEEGRLHDAPLRDNFVERLFAYRRLRALLRGRWRAADLIRFHTAHKLQLLAHEPRAYRELGRLVARAGELPRARLAERYGQGFMAALARVATPGRNADVLRHALGHLRGRLDRDARAELADRIEDYRRGRLPLIVPIALLRRHVRAHGIAYLAGQVWLEPDPRELMLRNLVQRPTGR